MLVLVIAFNKIKISFFSIYSYSSSQPVAASAPTRKILIYVAEQIPANQGRPLYRLVYIVIVICRYYDYEL
jgi:hypothetical protein